MDANTVIAICSVVIAVASLGVSAYVAWPTRKHNQLSAQPVLGFGTMFRAGGTAGLRLANSGLGPARIISSQLWFGDEKFGEFNQRNVDAFRDRLKREGLPVQPRATTLGGQPFLPTDYQEFLLSVNRYDPSKHGDPVRVHLRPEGHNRLLAARAGLIAGRRRQAMTTQRSLQAGGEPT